MEDCFGASLRQQILTTMLSTSGSEGVFYEGGRWHAVTWRSPGISLEFR
jgi:hypothetical protein